MINRGSFQISILCAGFGLGLYVPGLLLRTKLERLGLHAETEVFEELLPADILRRVEANRKACHSDFKVALAAQKIPGDMRSLWDPILVEHLLERWTTEDRRRFIVLSGYWVYVLDLYRKKRLGVEMDIDLLYIDADLAPSWVQQRKNQPEYEQEFRAVRLYNRFNHTVCFGIDANMGRPVPYEERTVGLVVHGGGWGIGTYKEKLTVLRRSGHDIASVCYSEDEMQEEAKGSRYMDAPAWRTWHRGEDNRHQFPPFAETSSPQGQLQFHSQTMCHGLHRIVRQARAIVSKPGAGTLIDSLAAATPLLLLEPFGPYEAANAAVWVKNGLGLPFVDWANAGYPVSTLHEIHGRLLHLRSHVRDYAEFFAERLQSNSAQA
jgi:hypothetical protein